MLHECRTINYAHGAKAKFDERRLGIEWVSKDSAGTMHP